MTARTGPPSPQVPAEFFLWLGVLAAIAAIGAVLLMWLRRRLRREDRPIEGFVLHDLREMHRRGELDDEEFERAKASLLQRMAPTRSENRDDDIPHDPDD